MPDRPVYIASTSSMWRTVTAWIKWNRKLSN